MIKSYRDLSVWRKAMDLAVMTYRLVRNFPKCEEYGLTSQAQRAAASVPANIAEGHGRAQTKVYLQFISIARGSLAELETHLLLAERLEYVTETDIKTILQATDEVGRMLRGLQKSLAPKS
jgi:four helix bundle protein